jgi:hypothetical protein
MRISRTSIGGLTATAALAAGVTTFGIGSAAADPADYTVLLVNPNDVTDSMAYSAAAPVQNPNNQQGVSAVYSHRDGRQITETVLVLPDAAGAAAAMNASQGDAANRIANEKTQPVQVGTGGTLLTGSSADGSKSMSLLLFTQGNAAATVEFDGPPKDPAPTEFVVDFGQKQDTAIRNALPA